MRSVAAMVVCVVGLALAGCLGDEAAPDPPGTSPADSPADPAPDSAEGAVEATLAADGRVLRATFASRGRMGVEVAPGIAGPQDSDGWQLRFPVEAGATAVVVEVAWNDTVQDLDAYLAGAKDCYDRVPFPDMAVVCLGDLVAADGTYGLWWNRDGAVGQPDSPSRIVATGAQLADAGTGTWQAHTWAKDASADLEFHVFATVLYDGSDPAAFTAVPWSTA